MGDLTAVPNAVAEVLKLEGVAESVAPIWKDIGAIVAVGAYNVGRISSAFDASWARERPWVTNRSEPLPRERRYDPPLQVACGSELMAFHLGSTVILLLPPGSTELTPVCHPGREVRLGEALVQPARQGELLTP